MENVVRLFRRETSSTEFIPVIDGLRFVAIAMVVVYHISAFVLDKSAEKAFSTTTYFPSLNIAVFGHQGVQLFFVISGFILALPFMRQRLGLSEKRLPLGKYFSRRLTRLEPPYIVSTILLFLMLVFVVGGKYPMSDLWASLVSSLLYVSNFVYPGEFPHINPVTWSLEIEIQYYLSAPFLIWGLCLVKGKARRRIMTVGLIVAFSVLGWLIETVWQVRALSLLWFLQYFLGGILLCDIFLLDSDKLRRLNNVAMFAVGLLLLVFLISFEHSQTPNLAMKIVSPLAIFAFYLIVFGNEWWKRVFSLGVLTSIGGMCYTIYLLHYAIISAVGRVAVDRVFVSNFYLYFAIQALIYIACILFVSSVYFLLIEKPCMKRDWHLKLWQSFRSMLGSGSGTKAEEVV